MKKQILFIVLLLSSDIAFPQKDHASILKQYMEGQNKYFNFNGNVLVAEKGKIIYQQALGLADYISKRKLDSNSIFELASVSKQFTAMGIMIMKEKGRLRLEDKVKKYFPALPYDQITIKQLLTHSSGLPEYEDQFEKYWDHTKIATNKDVIDMLAKRRDTLFFKPGEKFRYSNTGYALLASILEKVSGQSYNDFLFKYVFNPLGMKHSFVYNTRRSDKELPANYALGFVYSDSLKRYVLPDSLKKFEMVYYLDGIVGDGCVNSTLGDLYLWDQSFTNKPLLSAAGMKEMTSPQILMNARDSSFYGYGLMITPRSDKGKVISHTGGWPGYHTLNLRKPEIDQTIILLSNNEANLPFFRVAIESILNDETLIMPYEHKRVKIDPKVLDAYVGKYNAALTMEFIKKNDRLYRHREGTPDIELIPENSVKFFYGDGSDRQILFQKDNTGKIVKVWFINMGQKGEMKKMN